MGEMMFKVRFRNGNHLHCRLPSIAVRRTTERIENCRLRNTDKKLFSVASSFSVWKILSKSRLKHSYVFN
jgi:hypothetical protein